MDRSINRCVPGFFLQFSLVDPLGDHDKPLESRAAHLNPVMDLRLTKDKFWNAMRQVLHNRPFKWRITVKMEFVDDYGKTYIRPSEMVAYCRLPDADDHYLAMIESMFDDANMRHYRTTHVMQEVLKGQVITEADFTGDERGAA
ncbi:hypothetical protein [Motiliproteus sp.]|uniref:hypothetical protein n=1 Tax=Motiliproteus sp. TaxID=1898955 RepID=UPI003BACD125